ncbi:MAG TPA: metal-dependent hydrolase [Longimicrobiales bacterium]|nr:metal-dependent hydrolase [Longimicrobiales bacterium]
MARLTWHGHSCFMLETDEGTRILFDPWLDQNPKADIKADDIDDLDYILVSHGHWDHFADAIPLAKRTGAMLVSSFEIVSFAQTKGVQSAHPMSIGGGHRFPFGYAKMTPALHGGEVAGDDEGKYTTMPGGWWLDLAGGQRVYHAGDTALLMEMKLLEGQVDVALLPIGDNFTMGPRDAVRAVEFIQPRVVIPMHYNTFELIAQDAAAFAREVGDRAEVRVLEPGQSYDF